MGRHCHKIFTSESWKSNDLMHISSFTDLKCRVISGWLPLKHIVYITIYNHHSIEVVADQPWDLWGTVGSIKHQRLTQPLQLNIEIDPTYRWNRIMDHLQPLVTIRSCCNHELLIKWWIPSGIQTWLAAKCSQKTEVSWKHHLSIWDVPLRHLITGG